MYRADIQRRGGRKFGASHPDKSNRKEIENRHKPALNLFLIKYLQQLHNQANLLF